MIQRLPFFLGQFSALICFSSLFASELAVVPKAQISLQPSAQA